MPSAIDYTTTGSGPAVIVIPGALAVAADYAKFSEALAATGFTVHTVDRRGRGKSAPQGPDYSLATECADLAAVQTETGAHFVVGHSFGGLVALEFARHNPLVTKLAVYEPGVSVGDSIPIDWAEAYAQKLAAGQPADAFIIFIKATSPESRSTPSWLLKLILPRVMGTAKLRQTYALLAANLAEHREVARLNNTFKNYAEISAQTLIVLGSKSSKATHTMSNKLAQTIPHASIQEMTGLDHFGLDQKAPAEVARHVSLLFHERV